MKWSDDAQALSAALSEIPLIQILVLLAFLHLIWIVGNANFEL